MLNPKTAIPAHVPAHLVSDFKPDESADYRRDPYAVYARLRKEMPPIFYNLANGFRDENCWVVTRADDCREVLQTPELFTTTVGYGGQQPSWPRRLLPLEVDPPEHGKYKGLLAPLFSPKAIDRMERDVLETCTELMDAMEKRGECDFLAEFARPYPCTVFMKMMGLPMSMQPQFVKWEEMALNSKTPEEGRAGGQAIADFLWEEILDRRKNPKDDLTTAMTRGTIDGKPMSDADVHDMCFLLVLAGLDTVTAGHMHSFHFLATHPEHKEQLIKDPGLIPSALEELLRYHSWVNVPRRVTRDMEWHGVQMKKGDAVEVLMTLASRDPDQFPEPERMDFHREPNAHFAFAGGAHRCAGSHLARRELRVSIAEWLKRRPDFHLKPGAEIAYQTHGMFYPKTVQLVWSRRH